MSFIKSYFKSIQDKITKNEDGVNELKQKAVERPEFNKALGRIEDKIEKAQTKQTQQHEKQQDKMDELNQTLHGCTQAFIAAGSK